MIYGIIPARLESTRLPRKMLIAETGKPLIQHTWEAANRAGCLDEVIVATDSQEIAAVARGFGATVIKTEQKESGTDRVAVAVRHLQMHNGPVDIVVNIQGDEPEVDHRDITNVAALLNSGTNADIATLAREPQEGEERDPDRVKVVVSRVTSLALYFSRSPIAVANIHCGIYAYRPAALQRFASLPRSDLECWERLEQLRALEHGMKIVVGKAVGRHCGIDTPEDYRRFVERVRNGN